MIYTLGMSATKFVEKDNNKNSIQRYFSTSANKFELSCESSLEDGCSDQNNKERQNKENSSTTSTTTSSSSSKLAATKSKVNKCDIKSMIANQAEKSVMKKYPRLAGIKPANSSTSSDRTSPILIVLDDDSSEDEVSRASFDGKDSTNKVVEAATKATNVTLSNVSLEDNRKNGSNKKRSIEITPYKFNNGDEKSPKLNKKLKADLTTKAVRPLDNYFSKTVNKK
jgi:hypothetical protein